MASQEPSLIRKIAVSIFLELVLTAAHNFKSQTLLIHWHRAHQYLAVKVSAQHKVDKMVFN